MDRLKTRFAFADDAEVAIELDPTSLPDDRRDALRPMGVTRISLGVQDLEPSVQRAIGRMQSYGETEACAKTARALGVGSLNLDLIYGLPLQTEAGVARTARRALDLKADRVAVFGYAHVPWMKRHQALIPDEQLPGPATLCAAQRHSSRADRRGRLSRSASITTRCRATRWRRRWRRAGSSAVFMAIRPTPRRPLGFGASSIGSLPQGYVQNAPTAAAYAKEIDADRLATVRGISLSADDRLRRDVIERIMCDLEVDIDAVATKHRADPALLKAAASDGMLRFEEDGLASWDGRRIVVGERGRPWCAK